MDNHPNPSPVTEQPVSPDSQSVPQAPTESLGATPSNTINTASPVVEPASSRRKLWLIVGVVVVLIVAGLLAYMAMGTTKKATKTTTQTSSVSSGQTSNAAVNDATSGMTQGAGNESTITNTDDSGSAASMNQSAGNVGGSVNENNF